MEETSQTFASTGGPGIDFCTLKLVSLNACVFRFFLAEGWLALERHRDAVEMRRMRQLRQSVSQSVLSAAVVCAHPCSVWVWRVFSRQYLKSDVT